MLKRIATGLGVLALAACSRPNPAFEGDEVGDSNTEPAGDGDPGDGDPGDGDPGDGDGDPGDGDGDPGDGDGDPGDGDGDGDGDPNLCNAPEVYVDCDFNNLSLTDNPFAALGLGCVGAQSETMPLDEDPTLTANNSASWRVATHFGHAEGPYYGDYLWAAHEGEVLPGEGDLPDIPANTSGAILILSTGLLPPPGDDGGVLLPPGAQAMSHDNQNANGSEFPYPISPLPGSNGGLGGTPFVNCDGDNDCSDSLYSQWSMEGGDQLHNKMWLDFRMTPPVGVHGYMFDFAFFTSEYPNFVDTVYNDMFVAWSSSETYTGNLTFIGQALMNTTSLAENDGFTYTGAAWELGGTGFESYGSTSWLLARGPAAPGESVQITLFVSDLGDALFGSVVLLDNFRWDCGGCVGEDCGFTP